MAEATYKGELLASPLRPAPPVLGFSRAFVYRFSLFTFT